MPKKSLGVSPMFHQKSLITPYSIELQVNKVYLSSPVRTAN